ncbi:MAG: class I SAM-dependent methyltransferase [Rickettsiales bacterium]|nr:class I SAM-dependent methyltransferase [Rickettsiales bacterium]
MKWCLEKYSPEKPKIRVLDVGSQDVGNGSYRDLVPAGADYVGLDIEAGKNVNLVPDDIYNWAELADNSFDVVISGQAFEHTEFFWLTAAEMARVLKPGGILILIAPYRWPRHRWPVDCYRFDADGMVAIARWSGLAPLHATAGLYPEKIPVNKWEGFEFLADAVMVAKKPENWPGILKTTKGYICEPSDLDALSNGWVAPEKPVLSGPRKKRGPARLWKHIMTMKF